MPASHICWDLAAWPQTLLLAAEEESNFNDVLEVTTALSGRCANMCG